MVNDLYIEYLRFSQGPKNIVSLSNLQLKSGDWVTILGPNGAGKTSLIKSLIGLNNSKNKLRFNGKYCDFLEPQSYYYIPQSLPSGRGMNVQSLLCYSKYARSSSFFNLDLGEIELIRNIFGNLKLDIELSRYLNSLSGGELQKCYLAAAIFSKAPILILDEPTSNLDPFVYKTLIKTLGELKAQGKMIITVSHHFDGFIKMSNYLLAIKSGSQLFFCKPGDLDSNWEEELYDQ